VTAGKNDGVDCMCIEFLKADHAVEGEGRGGFGHIFSIILDRSVEWRWAL